MKTSLNLLSFVLAVGIPAAFAAQFVGFSLPAGFGANHALAAFVATLFLRIVAADYEPASRPLRVMGMARVAVRCADAKAVHPLAA